jgi:hypothetical protein
MTDAELKVELLGTDIIVTMPGTRFSVTYRKFANARQLSSDFIRDDRDAPIKRAVFLARAWRLANDKARELGWIV